MNKLVIPNSFTFNVIRIWLLCMEAARTIYRTTPPSLDYIANVARFLIEICAQEGAMQWERQRSPKFDGTVGGFSKWQMESAWIANAIDMLKSDPVLCQRVTNFVFADPNCPLDWVNEMDSNARLWALRMNDNDRFAIALCRVGILGWPEAIPATVEARADLWKKRYNTIYGAGTPQEYIANSSTLVDPILSGL